MPAVFLSYRRDDSADFCERIHDRLARRYGRRRVFRDTDAILLGSNFVAALKDALEDCRVMLVLIGPYWLAAADASGHPRLYNPNDFVRLEIATALREKKVIVPVLVKGAAMPPPAYLPPDIAGLAACPALAVHGEPFFEADIEAIIQTINRYAARRPASTPFLVVGALYLALLLLGLLSFGILPNRNLVGILGFGIVIVTGPVPLLAALIRAWRRRKTRWIAALTLALALLLALLPLGQLAKTDTVSGILAGLGFVFGPAAGTGMLLIFGLIGPRPMRRTASVVERKRLVHPRLAAVAALSLAGYVGFWIGVIVPALRHTALVPVCVLLALTTAVGVGIGVMVFAARHRANSWLVTMAASLVLLICSAGFLFAGGDTGQVGGLVVLLALLSTPSTALFFSFRGQ